MNTWLQECAGSFNRIFTAFPEGCQIPLREWTNDGLKFLVRNFGSAFDTLNSLMLVVLRQVETSWSGCPGGW